MQVMQHLPDLGGSIDVVHSYKGAGSTVGQKKLDFPHLLGDTT